MKASKKGVYFSYTQTTRRILPIVCATALATAFMASLPQPVHADDVPPTPIPIPPEIQVSEGNQVFLVGHGVGTQNYVCRPSYTGVAYILFTPQATLFNGADKQVTTHYFSPNISTNPSDPPDPNTDQKVVADGAIRATWQHKDTSIVWGKGSGSVVVDPTAIPWLRVTRVGAQDGPTCGNTLTATTFIQRLNTINGVAPLEGCASLADVGNQAFVPYEADYVFYRAE